MMRFWLTTFTAADNSTGDLGRVGWAFMLCAFVAFTGYALWRGQPWNPMEWATASGLMLAAGAGALWMKKGTEPPA